MISDAALDGMVAADARTVADMALVDGGLADATLDAALVESGWSDAPAVGTGAIQEIAVVALNGAIYVIGGFDAQARVLNRVSRFDPATGEWSAVADLPARMHHANAAVVDGRIWVLGFLGGIDFGSDPRGYLYDPADDTWTPGPSLPEGFGRGAAGTVAIGSTIYIVGGFSSRAVYPFVHAYDTAAQTWTRLPDLPTERDHMAIGAIDGKIVVAGGRAGAIGSHVDRVDIFDPAVGEWTTGAAMPTSRGGGAAAVVGGELFVIGGEGNRGAESGVFAEVEAYDLAADSWRSLDPMPNPRHGMWAASVDGRIYIPGGADTQAFGAVDTHEILTP
ncbi:MAG: N-acetylneuraminic acid mutarotase [Bradymonadia bacterium]